MYYQTSKDLKQKKKYLYKKQYGRCKIKGCTVTDIDALTIDHIVQQSKAKLIGWTSQQINHLENLQLLCRPHHDIKDNKYVNDTTSDTKL